MTNATKANILAFLNAVLALAVLFGAPLTEEQLAGIGIALNAGAALVVGFTYKDSPKRIPDEGEDF
jgi:hypothetical protein